MRAPLLRTAGSGDDLYVLPERHPAADGLRVWLRLRAVPDGVRADRAVLLQAVVRCAALPRADAVGLRRPQHVLPQRLAGEVVVALDDHGVVALRDDLVVPHGLHGPNVARCPWPRPSCVFSVPPWVTRVENAVGPARP